MTLTPAERAVLIAYARGGTEGAAVSLGLSPHTVRGRLASARRKLGAVNTTQAVIAAVRAGIVTLAELTEPGGPQ